MCRMHSGSALACLSGLLLDFSVLAQHGLCCRTSHGGMMWFRCEPVLTVPFLPPSAGVHVSVEDT